MFTQPLQFFHRKERPICGMTGSGADIKKDTQEEEDFLKIICQLLYLPVCSGLSFGS